MGSLNRPDISLESGFHAVFTQQQRITALIASPPRKPLIGANFNQTVDCSQRGATTQAREARRRRGFARVKKTRTRRVCF